MKKTSRNGLTKEEVAAMKDRIRELNTDETEGERAVLTRIARMPEPDREMATLIHKIIRASAPDLKPRLWYGMPAYAKDGKVVCHFQDASKFKTRYPTLGFSDRAKLDDGNMWPTSFALMKLSRSDEDKIAALVKKAVS